MAGLEGWDYVAHNFGRLSEVKLPKSEIFWIRIRVKLVKLEWMEWKINHDNMLKQWETQHWSLRKKRKLWCPQFNSDTTYLSKCSRKGTFCDESSDICVTLHKYLGVSVKLIRQIEGLMNRKFTL